MKRGGDQVGDVTQNLMLYDGPRLIIEFKTGDPLERAGLPFCFLGYF